MSDKVIIEDLEVRCRIGVTAAERRKPQRLLITVELGTPLAAAGRTDDLRRTIDYDAVARRLRALAARGERRLIERLAEEVARVSMNEFAANRVSVTVKKFVIPKTRFVAVSVSRRKRP